MPITDQCKTPFPFQSDARNDTKPFILKEWPHGAQKPVSFCAHYMLGTR